MRRFALAVLLVAAGCGGGTAPPPAPSPVRTDISTPVAAVPVTLSGRVSATVTSEALADVLVEINDRSVTTDRTGAFGFTWLPGDAPRSGRLGLSGPGIVSRSFTLDLPSSRDVTVDAISLMNGFDLDYYRRLVRNTADAPSTMQPLRRWTRSPRVYLRTVDQAGQPIDAITLDATAAALVDDAAAWTGGRFGILEIVRGSETREGERGWITVKWPNPANEGHNCGRAQVGVEGGWIELNYLNPSCACGTRRIGAGIVRHELGHALGFYHTNEPGDLMQAALDRPVLCDGRAAARERFHAAVAYSRPVGNTDPDTDPFTAIQRQIGEPIVIVD